MENHLITQISSFLEPLLGNMDTYWHVLTKLWVSTGFLGVSFGRLFSAFCLFAFFALFRRRLARFFIRRAHLLSRLTTTKIDDQIITALEPPLTFLPLVIGFFLATEYVSLSGVFALFAQKISRSLLMVVLFWSAFNVLHPIAALAKNLERHLSATMALWIFKILRVVILTIGCATLLEIWGISIGPVLAGFGLFSVAVGLGAKDLFQNLIAGIIIISEKRFNPGDWIRVEGIIEGTVENVGFRSTLVRRFDKAPVYVPNTDLSDRATINFSKMTFRRIYWTIGLTYTTDMSQLRSICTRIRSYLNSQPETFANPPETPLFVHVDAFGESSINIMVYCFTRTTQWGEWLRIKEELAFAIMEIVEEEGSEFAFPSTSLYVASLPNDKPEPFIPPALAKQNKKGESI